MTDLAKLKALAEAATAGPWISGGNWVSTRKDGASIADCRRGDEKFIAAANPAVVLGLIAHLDLAVEARDLYMADKKQLAFALNDARAEAARLKAENERLERNRDMWKGQVERQTEELRLAHEADKLLKSECEGLRESLTHAADEVESWGAYASDYFQQKHDLAGTVLKVRQAAVSKESGQ